MMKPTKWMILTVLVLTLLLGCGSLYPPPRKALLQVESPPHRTTMILDASDMTPEMVQMCMRINNRVKHQDYKFNENFAFTASGALSEDVNRNSSSTRTIGTGQ